MAKRYDGQGRLIKTVNYGTNGGSDPGSWIPADRANADGFDPYLMTTYTYDNHDGNQTFDMVTDPRGIVTRTYRDALGRTKRTIEGYVAGGSITGSQNRTIEYFYHGLAQYSQVSQVLPSGRRDTDYFYNTGVRTQLGEVLTNGVVSNDLLSSISYPSDDDGGSGRSGNAESFCYNALGEVVKKVARGGIIHSYSLDGFGRIVADAVSNLPPDDVIDRTYVCLSYSFDVLGHVLTASTWSLDVNGQGMEVNRVTRWYNGFGELAGESEWVRPLVYSGSGASSQVIFGDAYFLTTTYQYDTGHGGRLASMQYPNGRVVAYGYGSANSLNDRIGRVESVSDSGAGVAMEEYAYLGLGTVVQKIRPQAHEMLTYVHPGSGSGNTTPVNGDGGDQYTGLDRFGRVIDQFWMDTTTNQNIQREQYAYDADSNLLYANDIVNPSASRLYQANGATAASAYDLLGHQKSYATGTLSSTTTGGRLNQSIGYNQTLTYDATDKTSIDGTAMQSSVTVKYDPSGNVSSQNGGANVKYDAWGRVSRVTNGWDTNYYAYTSDAFGRVVSCSWVFVNDIQCQTVVKTRTDVYAYDQASNVIQDVQTTYASTNNSGNWLGPAVYRQPKMYVWSAAGPNSLILRDRDVNGDTALPTGTGVYEERLYDLQNAKGDTTAVVTDAGVVAGTYFYDLNGKVTQSTGEYADWSYLYHGWSLQATGLYQAGGKAYDPKLGIVLQPSLEQYQAGRNAYAINEAQQAYDSAMRPFRMVGTGVAIAAGLAVGVATFGMGFVVAGAAGGLVGGTLGAGVNGFADGHSGMRLAGDMAIGGLAGAAGGAAGGWALGPAMSIGGVLASGFVGGAVYGGIEGTYQGYMSTGTLSGALTRGIEDAMMGGMIGAATAGLAYGVVAASGSLYRVGSSLIGVRSAIPTAAEELEAASVYVQGRIGEIRGQLGRSAGFGETYAMGAVRSSDGTIKYYVASKSAYGVARVNNALLPGEELVGYGIDCDLHAEMLIEQIASSRGETLLGLGATSRVCSTYTPTGAAAPVPWCQWYFDQIGVPIWTPRR